MSTTTTRRKAEFQTSSARRLLALIDPTAPAKVRKPKVSEGFVPDTTVLRVPDFHEDGFAVFIGEDAAIRVEEGALAMLHLTLEQGGHRARTGHFPAESGIVVDPFAGRYDHPGVSGKHREAQAAWRMVQDTLLVGA